MQERAQHSCDLRVAIDRSASEVRPHAATPPDNRRRPPALKRSTPAEVCAPQLADRPTRKRRPSFTLNGEAQNQKEEHGLRTARILAIATALVSLAVVAALGAIGVWLTAEARVFGLVMLAAGSVAALLVLYFDWRSQLHRRDISEELEESRAA